MGHVAFPFNWKQFLFHRGCSINLKSILEAALSLQGEKKAEEDDKTVLVTLLDPWRNEIEEKSEVASRNQERYTTRLSGNALKTPCNGSIWPRHRKKHNILANKNACHHCSQDSDSWLYRESDISEWWDDFTGCCARLDTVETNWICGFRAHFGSLINGGRLRAVLDISEVIGRVSGRARCLHENTFFTKNYDKKCQKSW